MGVHAEYICGHGYRPALTKAQKRAAAGTHGYLDPPPGGGLRLRTVPLTPAAGEAFTPAEMEARIAAHAERVERECPPTRPTAVTACRGCGTAVRCCSAVALWRKGWRRPRHWGGWHCPACCRAGRKG